MKPVAFHFHEARTVGEAVAMLGSFGDEAKILAGGQSLGPMFNYRIARPQHVIDVHRIDELRRIEPSTDGGISIGAAVTHAKLEDERRFGTVGAFLSRIAHGIAFRAVRNRGTIGGSLAHSDPSADWPAVMCALDARFTITSVNGERTVPARQFFVGQLATILEPTEVLVRIDVPHVEPNCRFGYAKIARKSGEFAESLSAVVVELNPRREIAAADVWLGAAAAGVPLRMETVERLLIGARWNEDLRPALTAVVLKTLSPADKPYARYKAHLHTVSIARAIDDAYGKALAV